VAIHVLFDPTDFITDATGFQLFANLLFGSNGASEWIPELLCGSPTQYPAYANTVWDENLDDGFDSGNVAVQYDANLATGTTTFSAGSASAHYAGESGGTVGSVAVRAQAQGSGAVIWSDLTITFWDGSEVGESLTLATGATAETSDTATGVEEQMLVITPERSGYDHVTVSGTLRMQAGSDYVPESADLFGQILINPAA
jgi:hypothetical protein